MTQNQWVALPAAPFWCGYRSFKLDEWTGAVPLVGFASALEPGSRRRTALEKAGGDFVHLLPGVGAGFCPRCCRL